MKKLSFNSSRFVTAVLAAVFALSLLYGMGCESPSGPTTQEKVTFSTANPQIQTVMTVQDRYTAVLMSNPEVVGTAIGLTKDGKPAILVFAKSDKIKTKSDIKIESLAKVTMLEAIPAQIEKVPVIVQVTGQFFALQGPPGSGPNPSDRFDRPVPIGVSTGNEGECSAGTISCRVKKGGAKVFALSNNHVYALENAAPIGSNLLQPGRFDAEPKCAINAADVIGTLANFELIIFSTSANNTIDAAIASTTTANVGTSTPSNGYGTPKSAIVAAEVNQRVQKYGRTSKLTKGTITAINVTVNVGYSSGTARFVDQIFVTGDKGGFIKAGDSGSLLVTDPGRNPNGLLYAGDASGRLAVANRIDLVLDRFNVTIDGE